MRVAPMVRLWLVLGVTASMIAAGTAASKAAEPDAKSAEFFEQKVRPLLVERCFECHGNGQQKGGLSLDSAESLKKGGDSGPVVEPGKPDESLLIEALGHATNLKMPPKQKLADREIGDLTAWVRAGAVWPSVTVSIPLGNLFDDDGQRSLGDAIATDEFKATAEADDLGVERIVLGWGEAVEIASGARIDLAPLGSSPHAYGSITNDGWNTNGGLRSTGKTMPETAERQEDGVGMHANALVSFDLIEIRKAGGLPADTAFTFRSDRAGLNDDVAGSGVPSAHLAVLITRRTPSGPIVTAAVDGIETSVELKDGLHRLAGTIPEPLKADGRFVSFTVPVPGDAIALTLVATGAGGPADNPINSDHTVFSGARLELATTSSTLSRLGRTDRVAKKFVITDEQKRFWSFQPVQNPPVPAVSRPEWIRRPLDAFILAKLDQQKLVPAGPADRRTWIRRVTFDLIGLPPDPADVEAFLNDPSPDAAAKVVDRLLDSPRYGERWARMWLDVARYAEDQAHTFDARAYPQGYRYRDWVVRALNSDLPYDRFIVEQIAGDQLEPLPGEDSYDRLLALGYFALGPVYYADAGCAFKASLDELDDRIDTLSRGFLGLTVACARCHDHKFDPIPQTDYYALAGIFRSSAYREAPLVAQPVVDEYNRAQGVIKQKEEAVKAFLEEQGRALTEGQAPKIAEYLTAVWKLRHPPAGQTPKSADIAKETGLKDSVLEKWVKFLENGGGTKLAELQDVRQALSLPAENDQPPEGLKKAAAAFQQIIVDLIAERGRGPLAKDKAELLAKLFTERGPFAVPKDDVEKHLDDSAKTKLKGLRDEIQAAKKASPPMYPIAHSLTDGSVQNMKLHVRGNPQKTAGEVPRGFLSVLDSAKGAFSAGSGRLDLAKAIASPNNPLTARVIVNRIWQQHFGRGIVRTPSNFGQLGERPTHPELLDHLASQFVAHGWSLKWLHREIVLSATYGTVSDGGGLSDADLAANRQRDPDNAWLWQTTRRRLDVEAWRDAMLAVSGTIDLTLGGPSEDLAAAGNRRRTLYGKISRHNLDALLRLFDFPDPNITSDQRTVTTVPLQQLFVLNSEFLVGQAKTLSRRLQDTAADDPGRIRAAFPLLYGRPATDDDVALGLAFLSAADKADKLAPWEQYAQVLLAANEFTFVD